jgi:poly(A) polymerase/tRNA nucleotidyltransferase (CCA-adding enzyme)
VGDPDTRLAEDYLRALRFFRFQARYGVGEPDAASVAAIARAVPGLARLSAERVWMELKRILSVRDPVAAVALMAGTGVLGAVLPEVRDRALFDGLVVAGAPADPVLRLAALIDQDDQLRHVQGVGGVAGRLRMSAQEGGLLDALTGYVARAALPNRFAVEPGLTGDNLRRMLARLQTGWRSQDAHGVLSGRSWLAQALPPTRWLLPDAWLDDAAAWEALRARIHAEPVPVLPVAGRDVVALGVAPGPGIGSWLQVVTAWWLEGGCTATREETLAELAHRVVAGSAPADDTGPNIVGGGETQRGG